MRKGNRKRTTKKGGKGKNPIKEEQGRKGRGRKETRGREKRREMDWERGERVGK